MKWVCHGLSWRIRIDNRFSPHAVHLDKKVEVFTAEGSPDQGGEWEGASGQYNEFYVNFLRRTNQYTRQLHSADSRTFLKLIS